MSATAPVQIELVRRSGETTGERVAYLIAELAGPFVSSWLVMLSLAYINRRYPPVPAPGYWATFLSLYVLSVVGNRFRPSSGRLWRDRTRKQEAS